MLWWHWIGLLALNAPVYVLLGRVVFASWDGFVGSVRYSVSPEEWGWLRGEGVQDWWAEMELGVWLAACAVVVLAEGVVVDSLLFA